MESAAGRACVEANVGFGIPPVRLPPKLEPTPASLSFNWYYTTDPVRSPYGSAFLEVSALIQPAGIAPRERS